MIKSKILKAKLSKDAYIEALEAEIAMNNAVIDNIKNLGAFSSVANITEGVIYCAKINGIIKRDINSQANNSEEHF